MPPEPSLPTLPGTGARRTRYALYGIAVAVIIALATVAIGSAAPGSFPTGTSISIPKGATLSQASSVLYQGGIIRSRALFRIYATILDGTTGVKTGQYLFSRPESALRVAYRLVNGDEGYPAVKVTIPEGSSVADIGVLIARAIPAFDAMTFTAAARPNEGYLFPDTYFWPVNVTPAQIIADMRADFDARIQPVTDGFRLSGRKESDVIAMASIVEREATSSADRRIVAGILWKRLDADMALQVDTSLLYGLGTTTAKLTLDDLKMNSPYNLYAHAGLPPTPIDNPGLAAIEDTLHPTATPYLYFLSGTDGRMHYASDLAGHVANKYKYLD